MAKQDMRALVREILTEELQGLLHDVSYRLDVLYNAEMRNGRLGSRDLHLASHQLDGFTVTDNTPTAGKIAWTDCNVVYKGTNYPITDGSTDLKYVYWKLTTPATFQMSNTKPTIADDDVLVFINEGGTHQTVIGSGRMTPGAAILTGTVGTDELGSGAVSNAKLAAFAVDSGKLADNAVESGKIKAGAVVDGKIATDAVNSANIKNNAISEGKIATDAVTSAKIKDGQVSEGKIAADAVTSAKIKNGAVATDKLAGSAVTADKLGANAVTTDKLNNGAVTGAKIGAGQVATDKLNTALHMIF
jgi:hypothetical protein